MSRRLALIIGNSEYEDATLAALKKSDSDVRALAEVLENQQIGSFDEVIPLLNEPAHVVRREIARFFAQKNSDDTLLMYFSGHGVKDDLGRLYLATKNTEHSLLSATAVPASAITDEMDNSRSRRQILILDCCHSGAFAQGTKGSTGASVGTASAFEGNGFGRVVLTATDSTQYAWEGDDVIGDAENSVFTHYLIQGLRTGEADADSDGEITLNELYDYVYEQVVKTTPKQTPGKWSFKQQGEIAIARNLQPAKPAELPVEIRHAIDSDFPSARERAVNGLARLLQGSHRGLRLAAQQALQDMAENDDSRQVSRLAAEMLQAHAEGTLEPLTEEDVPGVRADQPGRSAGVAEEPVSVQPKGEAEVEEAEAPVMDEGERQRRLAEQYDTGKLALDVGNWDRAIDAFHDVTSLSADYRDVNDLLQEAEAGKRTEEARLRRVRETYERGRRAFEVGNWDVAITSFQQVVEFDYGYEDAAQLLGQARDRQVGRPAEPPPPDRTSPPVANTSGQGKDSIMPDEIRGWNWGAFLLNWIWSIGNKSYLGLLTLVPYVGFVMPFVLGYKGNEWAWRNKQWDSVEHFKSVQKKWTQWGLGILIAAIVLVFLLLLGSY